MTSRRITWIVLALMGAALLFGCHLVLRPFYSEIFLALVLSIVFYPAYEWLEAKTRRPGLSAWLMTLGTGVLFLLPVTMLGIAISNEMTNVMGKLNSSIGPSGSFEWLDRALEFVSSKLGWETSQAKDYLQSRLAGMSAAFFNQAVRSLQGIGSWIFSVIVTLVTMYFLFRNGARLVNDSKSWLPLPTQVTEQLYSETRTLMFANVYGVIAVAVGQGTLTAIGFWISGLPSALFWGSIAALLSVLPFVGAGIVWLPASLILLLRGDMVHAGILFVWGALIVSMADNVIRPIVLSERSQMNTAVMFFALLGGIDAFGLIGLFAGPIVFSLAIAVVRLLKEHSSALVSTSEPEISTS